MRVFFANGDNGAAGQSLKNLVTIAIQAAIEYPYRIYVMSLEESSIELDSLFKPCDMSIVAEDDGYTSTGGMDMLVKNAIEGMLDSRVIDKIFIPAMDYHLFYLSGSMEAMVGDIEQYSNGVLFNVLDKLEKYADLVMVDIGSKLSAWDDDALTKADLIVINVASSEKELMNAYMELPALLRKKTMFVVGDYVPLRCYAIEGLSEYYRMESISGGIIPANSVYNMAYENGNARGFMIKNNRLPLNNTCRHFIQEVKTTTRHMLEMIRMA